MKKHKPQQEIVLERAELDAIASLAESAARVLRELLQRGKPSGACET